ncbi:MAG: 3-dehydroquinate synthase [Chloroflexi bacterium]|nr:3-dehydroquinate synthase [Chloroflexota bacterium]
MAAELTVQGADFTYPVIIRSGVLAESLPEFVQQRKFSRAIVITNETLAPLYGEALAARLPGGRLVTVPDGEAFKNWETMQAIYGQLLAHGADRSTVIVALGGGVIGDMAGFAAATFMRGIAVIQAPTSLLAMVDASIGGKTGIDLPQGKNLVGAFKDPLAVFADTSTLSSLPEVEFRSGLAEVIKSGLIGDPALVEHIQAHGPQPIEDMIARAAAVKVKLVNTDRLEHGERAFLNLGHTFGHALEQASGYAWKHGLAVAVGTVAAVRLSARRELCPPELVEQVENVLRAVNLPVRYDDLDPAQLWEAMRHDKKWRNGAATFVLLEASGQPVIVRDVVVQEVFAVLESVRGNS